MICKLLESELLQNETKPHCLLWPSNPELSSVSVTLKVFFFHVFFLDRRRIAAMK